MGLFFQLLPECPLAFKKEKFTGGKKVKTEVTCSFKCKHHWQLIIKASNYLKVTEAMMFEHTQKYQARKCFAVYSLKHVNSTFYCVLLC